MKSIVLLLLFAAALVAFSGCVTPGEKFEQRQREISAINRNSRATLAAGEAIASHDPDRVNGVRTALDADEKNNADFGTDVKNRLAKMEAFKNEAIGAVAAAAKIAIPVGMPLTGVFTAGISSLATTLQAGTTSIESLRTTQTTQQATLEKSREDVKDTKTVVATLKEKLETKDKELATLKTEFEAKFKDFHAEFSALDPKFKEEAKQAIINELSVRKLVSAEELAKLKDASPDDVVARTASGGAIAAAALAALMSVFGKSRAEPELQKLREKIESAAQANTNLANVKKDVDDLWDKQTETTAGLTLSELNTVRVDSLHTSQVAMQTALASHEARLGTLEKK